MQDNIESFFTEPSRRGNNHNINIRKIFSRISEYWLSIILCIAIAMAFAFAYVRYATPEYLVSGRVLVKTDKKDSGNGALLADLSIGGGASSVENEVEILKSRMLMQRVVEHMDLNIRYYIPGNIQTSNLYDNIPFRFIVLNADSTINATTTYDFVRNDTGFEIDAKGKKLSGKYGDTLLLNATRFVVEENVQISREYQSVKNFRITVEPVEPVVDAYLSVLNVELPNKQINIINLSIKDRIPQRGKDVLKTLIQSYELSAINDKTEVTDGTIEFIDNRLSLVNGELTDVEKDIEGFKSRNRFTDIEAQSKLLLSSTADNAHELTNKEVQLRVLESLERHIADERNAKRIMPATLIAQDATLVGIINEYNALQLQRQSLLLSYTENSPYVKNVDEQLQNSRAGIKSYISSLKKGYEVSVNELKTRSGSIDNEISKAPAKERIFLDYSRKQQIKQELYLFLLKKREEAAISKSATVSSIKVIDAPKTSGKVSPVKSRIYLMALAIGLLIPGLRIIIREVLNDRIDTKADVAELTAISIVAEIGHNASGEMIAVKKGVKTVIAEQFRALRTNLQFSFAGANDKIVMVTSSMSGEGKSFVSANLASVIALSGKKVVLLELDLRKPRVSKQFGLNNDKGFSNYIIGQASLNEIIKPSGVSDDLYIVPSGTLPPNPSELLMSTKVATFFEELKQQFDYIVIDTAPVGLVTDAQILGQYTNAILYVLRQGYTYREQLRTVDALYKTGKLKQVSLVMNDVQAKRNGEYGAATYGSSYFDDETENATGIKRLIKRKTD